jgi:hypothetical protein
VQRRRLLLLLVLLRRVAAAVAAASVLRGRAAEAAVAVAAVATAVASPSAVRAAPARREVGHLLHEHGADAVGLLLQPRRAVVVLLLDAARLVGRERGQRAAHVADLVLQRLEALGQFKVLGRHGRVLARRHLAQHGGRLRVHVHVDGEVVHAGPGAGAAARAAGAARRRGHGLAERVDGDEADLREEVERVGVAAVQQQLEELAARLEVDALELARLEAGLLVRVEAQVAEAREVRAHVVGAGAREELDARRDLVLVRQQLHERDGGGAVEEGEPDLARELAEARALPALGLRAVEVQLRRRVVRVLARGEDHLEAQLAARARARASGGRTAVRVSAR